MKSLGKRPDGLRLERMKASLLWAGEAFRNIHPVLPGLRSTTTPPPTLKEFLCGGDRRVPRAPLPSVNPTEAWAKAPGSGLRATWLGHSTVLIEIDGLRVLTDPVWGPRASPSRIAGPKRFQPVPISLRALPPVDIVLVSHDHYDHLDYPTIRELARRDVPFVTSLGVGSHLEAWGVPPQRIVELDWWESHTLPNAHLTVTAAPSQHFSGRALKDRNATLWSSFSELRAFLRAERQQRFGGFVPGMHRQAERAPMLGQERAATQQVQGFERMLGSEVDMAPRRVERADLEHHQVERTEPLANDRIFGRQPGIAAEEHRVPA